MTIKSSTNSQSPLLNRRLKVTVLAGGIGEERDISLQSGNCVAQALKNAAVNVVIADITPDNLTVLDDDGIDVFFIALHGRFGEDGRLQQILEDRALTYTGSGPKASRLAFDKLAGKEHFARAGIRTPKAVKFDVETKPAELAKQLLMLGNKFVVKPLKQGSTIGVAIADDPNSAAVAARQCLNNFGDCMLEEYITGRDMTVGILENQALPIIEVRTRTGLYDYHAKYIDEQTEFLFDTIKEPVMAAEIKEAALACFNALGCRDFARVDFILSRENIAYALEVNTIPGMTGHSLLPKAAAKAGISMSDLCIRIIDAALENKKDQCMADSV